MSQRLPPSLSPLLLGSIALLSATASAQTRRQAPSLAPADPAELVVSKQAIDDLPGALARNDNLGGATASLGDLDGDGRIEVAVGAAGDDSGSNSDHVGAVYVLSLGPNGRAVAARRIGPGESGFSGELHPTLSGFGGALAALGDLDGDGVGDLAVGAPFEGNLWILFLNADGSVKGQLEIPRHEPGFGHALAFLGDLDGDGFAELAVGHPQDDGERGTVSILALNPDGSVRTEVRLGQNLGGFLGTLEPDDYFGSALTKLGDLDGDLVPDLAVGSYGDDAFRGAVWIVFLNADGSVKAEQKIDEASGGFTGALADGDSFGGALARIDDGDGDGLPELAIGAPGTGVGYGGVVWVAFLDAAGTVKETRKIGPHKKIRPTEGGFDGVLGEYDNFGTALALLEDLDGDGVRELAVGASGTATDACVYLGALWVLFLDPTSRVKSERKLGPGGLPFAVEPRSLASAAGVGDLDGDGAAELALGVAADCLDERGALWLVHLADASVASATRIGAGDGGFTGFLADGDRFGAAVAALGDLDGDGVADLAVGAPGTDLGGIDRGALWILFLNADDSVRAAVEIGQALGGFAGLLKNRDEFGAALGVLGDLDQDGVTDLVVGAPKDDDGGANRGAVWILFLHADGTVKDTHKISQTQGGLAAALLNNDAFGSSVAGLGDLDGDLVLDLAVGAPFHDTEDPDAGAVWTLFLNADGSVKGAVAFDPTQVGFHPRAGDHFGSALANLGDLDADGRVDLVVGAPGDDGGPFFGDDDGVLWRVVLAADGSASTQERVLQVHLGIGTLQNRDGFGTFLAALPDMNGDGITDLAVGHEDFFRLWIFHQDGLVRSGTGRALRR